MLTYGSELFFQNSFETKDLHRLIDIVNLKRRKKKISKKKKSLTIIHASVNFYFINFRSLFLDSIRNLSQPMLDLHNQYTCLYAKAQYTLAVCGQPSSKSMPTCNKIGYVFIPKSYYVVILLINEKNICLHATLKDLKQKSF